MIWVRGDRSLVEELAAREDVFHIYANPSVRFDGPVASSPAGPVPSSPDAIEWGVAKVHAPEAWALGFTGRGHRRRRPGHRLRVGPPRDQEQVPGLARASARTTTTTGTTRSTRAAAPAARILPSRATTTPTARTPWARWSATTAAPTRSAWRPGAKWIGCRNMNVGAGTPETYSRVLPVVHRPDEPGRTQNPDPSKAPHVINNSWGCPPSEGCTDPTILQAVVENTRAAGIEVVVSAGNAGSLAARPWRIRRRSTRRPSRSARPTAATTSRASRAAGP